MIKPFHKLSKQEFLWLVAEKTTYGEIEKDFPQPTWCFYHQATRGMMGCWSLVNFSSGFSMVANRNYCKSCDCYEQAGYM